MSNFTQAAQTIITQQQHIHSITDVSVIGSALNVKTSISGKVWVYHANVETTANATGVQYIIQGSWKDSASLNEDWIDLINFQTGTTAAVAAEIAGTEAAGQKSITVDADPTTAFTRGIKCYVQDAGGANDGEWARVDHSVAVTDVFLVDGLTRGKDSADTIWTQAEIFTGDLNLDGILYIRGLVLHTAATGSNIQFKMELVEATDFE